MIRPILIGVCLLALLGAWNTQAQSAEPDNAEIVELRKLLQQSIERIDRLEGQIAKLKKNRDLPVDLPNEESAPARRLLAGSSGAQPRYGYDGESVRREETQPSDEAKPVRRSTFNEQNVPETQPAVRVLLPTPVPKDWQRLEIGGQSYYLIPADHIAIPTGDTPLPIHVYQPTDAQPPAKVRASE